MYTHTSHTCEHTALHSHLDLHQDAGEVVGKGHTAQGVEYVERLHPRLARRRWTACEAAITVVSCSEGAVKAQRNMQPTISSTHDSSTVSCVELSLWADSAQKLSSSLPSPQKRASCHHEPKPQAAGCVWHALTF